MGDVDPGCYCSQRLWRARFATPTLELKPHGRIELSRNLKIAAAFIVSLTMCLFMLFTSAAGIRRTLLLTAADEELYAVFDC